MKRFVLPVLLTLFMLLVAMLIVSGCAHQSTENSATNNVIKDKIEIQVYDKYIYAIEDKTIYYAEVWVDSNKQGFYCENEKIFLALTKGHLINVHIRHEQSHDYIDEVYEISDFD